MTDIIRKLLLRFGLSAGAAHALAFLLGHLGIGLSGAILFGGLLLWTDMGGLGQLVFRSSTPALAIFLLFFGLFVTFGGIAMAIGVMGLGEERD